MPPPDMFDAGILEKWIRENMFKKDNARDNYLYDETGKVTLPVNEEGILILDPVSRTRIVGARMEEYIGGEYNDWIGSAIDEAEELGANQSEGWPRGLRAEVKKDYDTVDKEWKIVVNEERKQRGLTDLKAHVDWWDSRGHKLWKLNMEEKDDDETRDDTEAQSESRRSQVPPEDENNIEKATVSDEQELAPQDDEELPFAPPPSFFSSNLQRPPNALHHLLLLILSHCNGDPSLFVEKATDTLSSTRRRYDIADIVNICLQPAQLLHRPAS